MAGDEERDKIYKVIKLIKNDPNTEVDQQISFEEAQTLKGQEVLVVAERSASIYKINKINSSDEALPAAEDFVNRREYRSDKVIDMLWRIMMELYRKELGTTLEEYTKKMNQKLSEVSSKKEATDEKVCAECGYSGCSLLCSQCEQIYYCSEKCQLNNWPLHKALCFMDYYNPLLERNQNIRTIDDIPAWVTCLIDLLYSQPLFNGSGSIAKKCKVLPLDDRTDCDLGELLNNCAKRTVLDEKAWPISEFTSGLRTYSGKSIDQGLILRLYDSHSPCDLSTLKEAYTLIVNKVKEGWAFAHLEKYKDILHRKSEEEWHLLIKSDYLPQEDALIHCIARKCSLANKISCDTTMKNKSKRKVLYVWVKKEALEQFIHVFDCKFVNAKPY